MAPPPATNRFAVWALVSSGVLLFPLGFVFGVIALVQIARSQGRQTGVVLAIVALLVSGVVAPGAVLAAMYGRPKAFDLCYHTQENAVGVLRLISHLEEKHKEQHGRYGSLTEIGFKPRVSTKPYLYEVKVHEKDHFLATATGVDQMEGDLLSIDETKQTQRVYNRCGFER